MFVNLFDLSFTIGDFYTEDSYHWNCTLAPLHFYLNTERKIKK